MLISSADSLQSVFDKVKSQLRLATEEHNHPFRYCALATQSRRGCPGLRTVVLRRLSGELDLHFYTDARSQKVQQISDNPALSFLFYDPGERLQVRIAGSAIIHHGNDQSRECWQLIARDGWKSYSSVLSPGARIQRPEDAFSWVKLAQLQHFAVVEVTAAECEVLQLNRDEHLRAEYKKAAGHWASSWLTP